MMLKKDLEWMVSETKGFEDLESTWEYPTSFPALRNADLLAIDTETYDPGLADGPGWTRREGWVAGVSVAAVFGSDIFKAYYPVGHGVFGEHLNMDKKQVFSWLREELKYNNPKIFANASYDMGWLSTEDIYLGGKIEDIQIQAPICYEHLFSYSLDTLGKYFVKEAKDETLLNKAIKHYGLKQPKSEMWKLPPQFVGPYAEQDALLTLKLYNHFNTLLDCDPVSGQSLRQVYNLETALIPVLFKMQQRGIRVDTSRAEIVGEEFDRQVIERQKYINSLAGFELNVNSGDDLGRACDVLGIEYPRTAKTNKPSFVKEFLENHPSEFLRTVRETRKMMKAKSTFIEGAILSKVHNGRIYPQFHQLRREEDQSGKNSGTISGRFSCSGPNIQQISARDKTVAPLIRSIFLPEEDCLWGSFDYSQQEPRWTVHIATKLARSGIVTYHADALKTAENAARKYINDPNTDYHQMVADLANISRTAAKTINLGLAYGMGGLKLCKALGLPTEWKVVWGKYQEVAGPEGQEIINKYNQGAAYIKGLSKFCDQFAQDNGYVRTHLGRHCRFDKWQSADFDLSRTMAPETEEKMRALCSDPESKYFGFGMQRAMTYAAMNRVVQGSSADQTKLAMLLVSEAGYLPMGQIHDELAISLSIGNSAKEAALIKDIMEHCIELNVPSKVDPGIGTTWGEAKGG